MLSLYLTFWVALSPSPDGSPAATPNLLLLTYDTTRADHLSVYDYPQPTSPVLEELARGGVRFENAFTPVGLTGPAHASILTGLHPHRHGAVRNGIPIVEGTPTLATLLEARGYDTAAFLSGWTLKARLCGLAPGFDHYDDKMPNRTRLVTTQRDGRQTVDAALAWLDGPRQEPFFLWIHLFDPHAPYRRHKGMPITGDQSKIRAYDTEIRYADLQAGRVLRELEARGMAGRTLVVMAADHGESLGEGGVWGHSYSATPEVLQVPLILRWPGRLPVGRVVQDPVSLVDVTPTVLSLMGLGADLTHDGRDLSRLARGTAPGWPSRRTWFVSYAGVRRGPMKIFSRRGSRQPLKAGYREGPWRVVWDLKRDTVTLEPLGPVAGPVAGIRVRAGGAAESPPVPPDAERAREEIDRWLRTGARLHEGGAPEVSEDDLDRLRSLGYVP